MNAKLGYELDHTGAKRLLAAIVEQGVADLRRLQKRGFIVAGKYNSAVDAKLKHKVKCEQVLHFFQPEGMAQKTMEMLRLETGFAAVRSALHL